MSAAAIVAIVSAAVMAATETGTGIAAHASNNKGRRARKRIFDKQNQYKATLAKRNQFLAAESLKVKREARLHNTQMKNKKMDLEQQKINDSKRQNVGGTLDEMGTVYGSAYTRKAQKLSENLNRGASLL